MAAVSLHVSVTLSAYSCLRVCLGPRSADVRACVRLNGNAHTPPRTNGGSGARLTQLPRFIQEKMQSLLPRVTASGDCQLVNPQHTHTNSPAWMQLPDVIQAPLHQSDEPHRSFSAHGCIKQMKLRLTKCELDNAVLPPLWQQVSESVCSLFIMPVLPLFTFSAHIVLSFPSIASDLCCTSGQLGFVFL